MDDIGFLPKFKGIGIHDCFAPYFKYGMIHALCNAHLLRENDCAEEMGQEWAGKMSELLLDLNLLTDCHGGMLPPRLREWAVKEYRKITAEGMAATGGEVLARHVGQVGKRGRIAKPKYRNLLERYIKYEDAVLRFTTDVNVPFTNNDAERPIRAIKLHLKVSGCFRSEEMGEGFLLMMGYLDYCRKNGINGFEAIKMLIIDEAPEFITKWLDDAFKKAA